MDLKICHICKNICNQNWSMRKNRRLGWEGNWKIIPLKAWVWEGTQMCLQGQEMGSGTAPNPGSNQQTTVWGSLPAHSHQEPHLLPEERQGDPIRQLYPAEKCRCRCGVQSSLCGALTALRRGMWGVEPTGGVALVVTVSTYPQWQPSSLVGSGQHQWDNSASLDGASPNAQDEAWHTSSGSTKV